MRIFFGIQFLPETYVLVDFSKNIDDVKPLTITEVIDYLNEELGNHFFPPRSDGKPARQCPACEKGELSLKLGKFGAFIGCSDYPECKFTRPLMSDGENEGADLMNEPKELGKCPDTGRSVSLRRGPYGPYVQIDAPPETAEEAAAYEEKLAAYEERYAKRLANAVVKRRVEKPFTHTVDLAEVLKAAHPAWEKGRHPATVDLHGIPTDVVDVEMGAHDRVDRFTLETGGVDIG